MKQTENSADKKNTVRVRLAELWRDKRGYWKRFLVALPVMLCLCFTVLFFGPVEITASSADSLVFGLADTALVTGIFSFAVVIVSSFLLAALRGRIFNYTASVIFAATLGSYIQGNFLSGRMGALTGDAIAWQEYTGAMLGNLAVWAIVLLAVFFLLYLNKKIWTNALQLISCLLVVMQLAGLGSILASQQNGETPEKEVYLSDREITDFSKNKNVLVFLLDRLDYDYIEQVLAQDPGFFDRLDGFTSYTNAIAEFARTRPGASFMLSGFEEGAYRMPAEEYFEKQWTAGGRNLLADLTAAGFTVDLYGDTLGMIGSGRGVEQYVSNLSTAEEKLNAVQLLKNVLNLSFYRYAPQAMKPFFWCYTDDVNRGLYPESERYEIDEAKYAPRFAQLQLKEQNYFKFYHFNGPHPPYTLKEDGTRSAGKETDAVRQLKGSFRILYKLFDQLKAEGIYEDSAILILADHGSAVSDYEPVTKATTIGLFYKPVGAAGTPLQYSDAPVSHKNIPATIMKAAGAEYAASGTPLDEVAEDAQIVRHFYKSVMVGEHESEVYVYDIIGDARVFENWKVSHTFKTEYYFY